jgi:hypothetical protein
MDNYPEYVKMLRMQEEEAKTEVLYFKIYHYILDLY